jgi:uncharacterized protein YutE (UPF0331/DUF86 family)
MNDDVLLAKFTKLSRCVGRIREKTPLTTEALDSDIDAQDIITLNLERAVQICVDVATHLVSEAGLNVPESMAESFTVLATAGILTRQTSERMRKAVGFRNLAVHEYSRIDWEIVHALITIHLDDFSTFAREVTRYRGMLP